MTMVDPIPTEAPFGRADWQDYKNNWREVDAEWVQGRAILRYEDAAKRDSSLPGASAGQVVYNQATDALELRSKLGTWLSYRALPQNLKTVTDTAATVKIAHAQAGDKGLIFGTTGLSADMPLSVLGVLSADLTGVSIKVGAKTAKLSTDVDSLVSDSPITAPSIELTGTGEVLSAPGKTVAVGTLTAAQINATNIGLSGTLTGGVLNGASGTIGGVGLVGSAAYAASGFIAGGGYFGGASTVAQVRRRDPADGSLGAASVNVTDTYVQMIGDPDIYLDGQLRFRTGKNMYWYDAAGTHRGYVPAVVYSATDPGAANFPNGSIWFS